MVQLVTIATGGIAARCHVRLDCCVCMCVCVCVCVVLDKVRGVERIIDVVAALVMRCGAHMHK